MIIFGEKKDKIHIMTISDLNQVLKNHNFKKCNVYIRFCDKEIYLKFGLENPIGITTHFFNLKEET